MHGAFPKIDRWSSRSHFGERTLQDCVLLRSAFGIALTFRVSGCQDLYTPPKQLRSIRCTGIVRH
uniref:Similarity. Hypothetical start n=1 Tax=Microcystis aeruginosa (strain PCC 7806) TaxID=267872 RepID=A8YDJ5_MICA7|nr:unnamed protein product [Microcystis aeruginosa PCC 7806]